MKFILFSSFLLSTLCLAFANDAGFKSTIQPILYDYCGDCHFEGAKKGGLALDKWKSYEEMIKDQKTWIHVIDQLECRIMPPPKEPKLNEEELEKVVSWIEKNIFNIHPKLEDPGLAVFRRINRREYDRIIEDVFKVKPKASEILPTDDSHDGFDHLSEGLSLSPLWMERLMMAADRVVKLIFWGDDSNRFKHLDHDRFSGGQTHPQYDFKYLSQNGTLKTNIDLKEGQYKFKFAMCGDQAGDEPVKAHLIINKKIIKTVDIKVDRNQSETHEIQAELKEGMHEVAVQFINDYWNPELKTRRDRNFALRNLLIEQVPTFSTRPAAFKNLFENISMDLNEEQQVNAVLYKTAQKLYRRNPSTEEMKELMDIYHLALKEGESSEASLGWALKKALISPSFIFLTSHPDKKAKPDALSAVPIDEFSLATRLSFFLWGTSPDSYLLNLADKGELRKNWDKVVDRMLSSGRTYHLTNKFASQWLELSALEYSRPDERVFKEFNWSLKSYFKRETLEFFKYISQNNRPISEFLNADYTFVNSHLSEFYGLPKQNSKDRFVKVQVNNPQRGGLLGQGAILMMTSFNKRTSPVLRGKWLMEKVMGLPPAPPPPDAPELEEVVKHNKGKNLTLRQQLELHRSKKECMSCHSRMDPLGFAMENFNGIGKWRDKDEKGMAIDAGGVLISGEKFNNFQELKKILSTSYQKEFNRVLTESMLKFALGRSLTPQDRTTVRNIVNQLEKDDRFNTLIKSILSSRAFQTMRLDNRVSL